MWVGWVVTAQASEAKPSWLWEEDGTDGEASWFGEQGTSDSLLAAVRTSVSNVSKIPWGITVPYGLFEDEVEEEEAKALVPAAPLPPTEAPPPSPAPVRCTCTCVSPAERVCLTTECQPQNL